MPFLRKSKMDQDRWEPIETEEALVERMTRPSEAVREALRQLEGPILILGAGGKMGPSLAELLVRGGASGVVAVSRFSRPRERRYLDRIGVETISSNLLDEDALAALPEAPCVFLLVGYKFGATGNEGATWATNAWLPGQVMQRYPRSRIVYLSSGNVYAFAPAAGMGCGEEGEVSPVGEYAWSRLAGERVAAFWSERQGTPVAVARLFYATELRYGIIHDLAWKVWRREPIDLRVGHVNQIWQGDANAYLARLFPLCSSPPAVINITGPQVLPVRRIARDLGRELGVEPLFTGVEQESALIGDPSMLVSRFGPPSVPPERIVRWMARWVRAGGRSLGKPTGYESRQGRF